MEKKTRAAKTVGAAIKSAVSKVVAKKEAAPKVVKSNKPQISAEEFLQRVAFKAHDIYLARGCGHGDDQSDWFNAEKAVRAELGL